MPSSQRHRGFRYITRMSLTNNGTVNGFAGAFASGTDTSATFTNNGTVNDIAHEANNVTVINDGTIN